MGQDVDVVLGLGLNLRSVPPGLEKEAVALSEYGLAPTPVEFAKLFLEILREELEVESFAELRERWERAARLAETTLEVLGEGGGEARGLELLETGELMVRMQDGSERKLASEDVSLRIR